MDNDKQAHLKDSLGLEQDIQRILAQQFTRRNTLLLGIGGITTLLTACGGDSSSNTSTNSTTSTGSSGSSSSGGSTSSTSSCSVIPTETEGPYPADGHVSSINALTRSGIVRQDITPSLFTSTVAQGVALTLAIKLVNTNNNCSALTDYAMYVWHCDRSGNYSLYSTGLSNEDYLRGVQASDANGMIYFKTIIPGCYSGRWPHIHFEIYPNLSVASTYRNQVKTSQFALPSDICSTVYNNASGYSASITNLASISLSSDNVFSDGYSTQMMSVSGSITDGYTASIVVGISV